jgi:hypothetical protein
MKVDIFVTKYALTDGIRAHKGVVNTDLARMASATVDWEDAPNGWANFYGKDYHTTLEAAQARVVEMIEAKRKSHHKALKKLDALQASGARVVRVV